MHVHFLDPFRPGNSPIHKADPRIKLVLTVAFIVTSAVTPLGAWPVYILLFAIALSVELLSELGVAWVLKRSVLALPFTLAALPLVFNTPGQELFTIPLGFGTLTATLPGLDRFASIAVKSWLSLQMAIVLASSTAFPDLLLALRAVKVPKLMVAIFGLMWRYLFVLVDEAGRLMRAREARSAAGAIAGRKGGGSIAWRAQVTGGMAGNLFLRSFERGDRIYAAMASRGYDGEIRSFPLPEVPAAQWVVLIGGLLILALLAALGLLFW